jgi:hypothetical protein
MHGTMKTKFSLGNRGNSCVNLGYVAVGARKWGDSLYKSVGKQDNALCSYICMEYMIRVNTSERQHDMQALDNLFFILYRREMRYKASHTHVRSSCLV